ncbi:hypothetical protein HF888_02355 [Bermanella marisrubri]|nr:hypothetical protein [Bermanella marisrubri]QIZ83140.1 hypothetical protein HF888_02355 [Bermanella marisrubri]
MKKVSYVFALLLFSLSHSLSYAELLDNAVNTEERWVDAVDLKSGALMGLVHVSAENHVGQHRFKAGLGYTPKLDDQKEMGLASIGYAYEGSTRIELPWQGYTLKPWTVGVGILHGNHDDLFTRLPDQYPDGYYKPTSIRILFNYQMTLETKTPWEVYVDLTVLDVGFINYIRQTEFYVDNYEFLGLSGITNLGFGARYRF